MFVAVNKFVNVFNNYEKSIFGAKVVVITRLRSLK